MHTIENGQIKEREQWTRWIEAEYLDKTLLDRKQWYEEDNNNIWDIDYANLAIHNSQEADKIRRQIIDKTPTKSSGDK